MEELKKKLQEALELVEKALSGSTPAQETPVTETPAETVVGTPTTEAPANSEAPVAPAAEVPAPTDGTATAV